MANTPAVDEWLEKTNGLQLTAISISGNPTIDRETSAMMRQIITAATALITVLQRLPPEAPMLPPPGPPPGVVS